MRLSLQEDAASTSAGGGTEREQRREMEQQRQKQAWLVALEQLTPDPLPQPQAYSQARA